MKFSPEFSSARDEIRDRERAIVILNWYCYSIAVAALQRLGHSEQYCC